MRKILSVVLAAWFAVFVRGAGPAGRISLENIEYHIQGDILNLQLDYILDSIHLSNNGQILVTPVFEGSGGQKEAFATVLINGRNMHYAYERGTVGLPSVRQYDVTSEVRRYNNRPQRLSYASHVPLRDWMYTSGTGITFLYDTCGCGRFYGKDFEKIPIDLNPVKKMRTAWLTPAVTDEPVRIYEGKARVQFEVNQVDLHTKPYVCRNGQRIDNTDQLKIIRDSITYATADPNVEIARIEITGFASPESPYIHNEYLATYRSRALSEHIEKEYTLPPGVCSFGAVAENWEEFRAKVDSAKDITDRQRADLLELIDRPVYGPADYDAKEKELDTNPKFAELYHTKIRPEWFPELRATKFAITTRLKPLPDEKLAEVILSHPELMTLNQMYRVARLYDEESPEFHRAIAIALGRFPDSPEANTLGAVIAIQSGDFKRAEELLKKAGDSPQAENARGILATKSGDFKAAVSHFNAAGKLPEAQYNKALLGQ